MNRGKIVVTDVPAKLKESVVRFGHSSYSGRTGKVMSFGDGELQVLTHNGEEKVPRITDVLAMTVATVFFIALVSVVVKRLVQ
ncbi:MAG: hypothetical protein JRN09_08850 [Nitrososphaerota archaeon]|jgi:RNase P/RNase MRP subunit p29|nr:hypothetical protein [Nitrososphaerota archaeon]